MSVRRRIYPVLVLAALGLVASCSRRSEDKVPSATSEPVLPSPSASAATAQVPSPAKTSLPPFEKRFHDVELDTFARAYDTLPKLDEDLPREIPGGVLRKPQIPLSKVVGGEDSFCGITSSGTVRCWGGKLDAVHLSGAFSDLAVGRDFVCAIATSGKIDCSPTTASPLAGQKTSAGSGADGGAPSAAAAAPAVPPAPTESTAPPEAPAPPSTASLGATAGGIPRQPVALVAQGENLCIRGRDGETRCASKLASCDLAPPPDSRYGAVTVSGSCFACGVKDDGTVECWGSARPKSPATLSDAVALVAGDGFVCAVRKEGQLGCFGEGAPNPGKGSAIAALGKRACWLDDGHLLRCNDRNAPRLRGELESLALSARATCARELGGAFTCEGAGKIEPPVDPYQLAHPSWAPTPKERDEKRGLRRKLLGELAARFPEKQLPVALDRTARFPIGPFVEGRYLPLLRNVDLSAPLTDEQTTRHWRYAFRLVGPSQGTFLVLATRGALELFAFDDDAELVGQTVLVARRYYDFVLNAGCVSFYEDDAGKEELIESKIDERGRVTITGRRTRERKAVDPDSKKSVYQCHTQEMTATVTLRPWRTTGGGWQNRSNSIGAKGCGKDWPLGTPFWIRDRSGELEQAASAMLPSCVTF